MKLILGVLLLSVFNYGVNWNTDFEKAKAEAAQSHKLVMLNFSGSDWCGNCIRMDKQIFESSAFEKYAEENLVLVKADFPRSKRNQLSKEQTKINERLADKYNVEGEFALIIFFDENGKILKKWNGCPDETSEQFISEINAFAHVTQ